MVKELKLEGLDSAVKASEVVFIDFFADWCGPCRAMMPVIEELSEEAAGKVSFYKVNVDQNEDFAGKFGVSSIPSFFILRNGKVEEKIVGMRDKEILKKKLGL